MSIYFTRKSETFLFYSLLSYFRKKTKNKAKTKTNKTKQNETKCFSYIVIKQLDVPNLSLFPLVIYHQARFSIFFDAKLDTHFCGLFQLCFFCWNLEFAVFLAYIVFFIHEKIRKRAHMNNMKKIQLGYFQPGWTGVHIKRFFGNSWHEPLVVD